MKNDLQTLREIQEWDKQIYAFRDQLESIPSEATLSSRDLESEQAKLKQLEAEIKQLQLKQKEREGELASKEENVRKFQAQLAQVKTNKEYSSLQGEIASLKADNSLLEEAIIVLLDQVEDIQVKVRDQKKNVEIKEKEHKGRLQELETKSKNIQEEIKKLSELKKEKIKSVEPEIASLYERIVQKKRGLAFVKVEGEVCGACQMRLRPQILNEVMSGEKVVVCESCSRMLYIDSEQEA